MKLFKGKKTNIIPRRQLDFDVVDHDNKLSGNFRRNQTLPGASQNPSVRLKTHHLSIKRQKVMSVFIVAVLSSMVIWLLVSNFTAKVSVVIPSALISKGIDKVAYENEIQEYLDANPLSRFRFLLDQSALKSFIVSKFPEVGDLAQKNMSTIGETNFNINMRSPVAGWLVDGKQEYVDANGVAFEKNYFDTPGVQILDQSGASMQAGASIVSKRFLSFVGRVVSESKRRGYTVVQAILPANTTRELQIKIGEGDYLAKLSIDRPVGEQVEDMVVSIDYFKFRNQKPEYIDVRVSGKAFYK